MFDKGRVALLLGLLFGCKDQAATADDSAASAPSPCADGLWGSLPDPGLALHVRAEGDDAGDGTSASPFASLGAAIDAGRATGAAYTIFLGPGSFTAHIDLDGSTDPGVYVGGCGVETVILPESQDDATREFALRVAEVQTFTLERLVIEGGERPLWIWEGTHATVSEVEIIGARRTGILYDGVNTVVQQSAVSVRDTVAVDLDGFSVGYGISVRNLASFSMVGGGVYNSTGLGLVVDGTAADATASVSLTDVEVSGTLQDNRGLLGRGVHLQVLPNATLSGVVLADNFDAGLYAVRTGALSLSDVLVSDIVASDIGTGETSGDGVVITAIDATNPNPDPALFTAQLTNNGVSGAARVGILFERVSASVEGNTAVGGSASLAAQDGAIVTGAQAGEVVSVEGLGLNREIVALDALSQ